MEGFAVTMLAIVVAIMTATAVAIVRLAPTSIEIGGETVGLALPNAPTILVQLPFSSIRYVNGSPLLGSIVRGDVSGTAVWVPLSFRNAWRVRGAWKKWSEAD